MIKLYFKNGEEAAVHDVMRWWVQEFPNPPFSRSPKYIVEARRLFEEHLEEIKHFSR